MKSVAALAVLVLGVVSFGCSSSTSAPPLEPTGYQARVDAFFDLTIEAEPRNTYSEVMRVARGVAPDESKIQFDLDRLVRREDTSDFKLPVILWMLYEYGDSDLLSPEILANTKETLLQHKFWPDERMNEPDPEKTDSMVYVTENHFILYASSAYLVGQLYPDEVFAASGETGAQKMETFRPRVMRWLELRYRSGFSEWLSNVYYDEDIPGLIALVELAEDEEIRQLATMVLDTIYTDIALNQYEGTFGSTHGRTYEDKMGGSRDNTGSTAKLLFDLNEFAPGNMSSSLLALSSTYQLPRVIYEMAHDSERSVNRQRMGIRLEEAADWGLDTTRFEDGMTFMTLEAYTHPLTIGLWVEMLEAYGWWQHDDYSLFEPFRDVLENELVRNAFAIEAEKDITRNMRPEVNIYTHRTPSYMLSTAQDWRKGFGGDQQSIWQATLGKEAVAFTTHPGNESWEGDTPRYWTGYGTMPRAIQVENVVISLYDVDTTAQLYVPNQPLYTHAFLDKSEFDEAYKEGGWFFARYGDGYLALWASDPDADWLVNDDPDHQDLGDHEIIADGEKTIWICELGGGADYASFDAFKGAILAAPLSVDAEALTVDYESPSQGRLLMGWDGPLMQDGVAVDVADYPRYDNPYGTSDFPGEVISFRHRGQSLRLDFANRTREVNRFLD
ncbi:MAG: hypothetical protein KJO40_12075 [Deltaproteobacteria bacterium]|nr:hypothetical protein [Deltaproteobacteria bacterium]NND29845.1 hypothetical protein [Myxococcales bacterium]MBT8463431.1 hypothetical protein [Deltaproteobacteria bacterium]MBT8482206.1 hypothetical protein [Deltaproteobacteria bacterium]NNK09174.1 hypothetical protein [Myxococcales bacterium]